MRKYLWNPLSKKQKPKRTDNVFVFIAAQIINRNE